MTCKNRAMSIVSNNAQLRYTVEHGAAEAIATSSGRLQRQKRKRCGNGKVSRIEVLCGEISPVMLSLLCALFVILCPLVVKTMLAMQQYRKSEKRERKILRCLFPLIRFHL